MQEHRHDARHRAFSVLCGSFVKQVDSFDDHGMCAAMPNSVIKAGQAMTTVELDQVRTAWRPSVSVDVKSNASPAVSEGEKTSNKSR
jgi:hypothetical protein